jgi:hypothetical protein
MRAHGWGNGEFTVRCVLHANIWDIQGSTLEHEFDQKITGKPLWSAQVIRDAPEIIVDAHLAFLRAGAIIIKTSKTSVYYLTGPMQHPVAISVGRVHSKKQG